MGSLSLVLAVALSAIAVGRLLFLIYRGPPGIDFFGLWTAGRMWAAALDPYGNQFRAYGMQRVGQGLAPVYWLYPPQWWLIARPFAALRPQTGLIVWNCLNLALFLSAFAIAARAARRLSCPPRLWLVLLAVATAATMQSTSYNLFAGQTALVTFFGIALVLGGTVGERDLMMGLGIAILLLKPQVGIPVAIASFTRPEFRRAALIGVGLTMLACLPFLLSVGVPGAVTSMEGLLANVRAYGTHPFNAPATMLGVDQFLILLGRRAQPVLAALGAATVLAICFRLARERRRPELVWLAVASVVPLIVPLHDYDVIFVSLVLLVLPGLAVLSKWMIVASVALVHRPGITALWLPFADALVWQPRLMMLGVLLILLAFLVELRRPAIPKPIRSA